MPKLLKTKLKMLLDLGTSPEFSSDVNRKTALCNRMSAATGFLVWLFSILEFSMGQTDMATIDVFLGFLFTVPLFLNSKGKLIPARVAYIVFGNVYLFFCSAMQGEQSGIFLAFFVTVGIPWVLLVIPGPLRTVLTLVPIFFYAWLKFTGFRPLDFLPHYPAPPEFFIAAVGAEFYLCFMFLRFVDGVHRDYNSRLEELIRQLQQERQKTLEQQEKMVVSSKMAALGEMAAGVAHEINNPLAAIQLMSSQILIQEQKREAGSTSPVLFAAKNIQEVVKRISKIIEALRRFAGGGADPAATESVSLNQVVDDTIELCQARLKSEGLRLEVLKDPADTKARCNPNTVSQVLLNLLNNAWDALMDKTVKATAEPRIQVTVSVSRQDRFAEIRVRDNGPGVPPSLRHKIFEPFFTTKPVGRGIGLGLSLSQGLMRSQSGSLELVPSSTGQSDGGGACFLIRIPLSSTG